MGIWIAFFPASTLAESIKGENMSEATRQNAIRISTSRPGVRLFRNNVGMVIAVDRNGKKRKVTYGLCPGSGDLIGWKEIIITQDMVGQKFARFLSVEVKGKTTPIQDNQTTWKKAVNKAGGIAGIARTADEANAIIEEEG